MKGLVKKPLKSKKKKFLKIIAKKKKKTGNTKSTISPEKSRFNRGANPGNKNNKIKYALTLHDCLRKSHLEKHSSFQRRNRCTY